MAESGFFLALTRDDARRLFGLRGDADVLALAAELRGSPRVREEQRLLPCSAVWEDAHRLWSDCGLPLAQAILGGREMTSDASPTRATLKRPDLAGPLADVLNAWGQDAGSGAPEATRALASILSDFYARAAAEKWAVLFVAEKAS